MFGLSTIAMRWIGGALFVLLLLGAVYAKGWLDRDKDFSKYKVEVKALAMAQEQKTQQVIMQQDKITKKASDQYAKDLAAIRNTYQRLRYSNGSGIVSTIPDTASDPAGATTYYLSIAPELATGCAETTSQLIALQNWVKEQSDNK